MIIDLSDESVITTTPTILPYNKSKHKQNIITHNENKLNLVSGGMLIGYFIEGVATETIINKKIKNITNRQYYEVFTEDNTKRTINLVNDTYMITSDNYYKIFYESTDMIRGFINGIIDVQKCNVTEDSLFIKCFRRSDNLYIGEYKVTAGTYSIPNLDVNEEYDIVLFDKSMTIEQQVSSKRKPAPY